jgi:hypothetical protein
MTHHAIEVKIRSGGVVEANIVCSAPEGANCRKACVNECGEYCGCSPELRVDGGECLQRLWITEGDPVLDLYDGPEAELRSGPIAVAWDRSIDGYVWRYAPLNEALLQDLLAQAAVVREFLAQKAGFEVAVKNCPTTNKMDRWRWRGHIEAREELLRSLIALDQKRIGALE